MEGEALLKLRTVGREDGLIAYQKLFKHHYQVAGNLLTERRTRILFPEPPKKVQDLGACIEKWERDQRELRRLDPAPIELPVT